MFESSQSAARAARVSAKHFPDAFPNRVHRCNQIGQVDREMTANAGIGDPRGFKPTAHAASEREVASTFASLLRCQFDLRAMSSHCGCRLTELRLSCERRARGRKGLRSSQGVTIAGEQTQRFTLRARQLQALVRQQRLTGITSARQATPEEQ